MSCSKPKIKMGFYNETTGGKIIITSMTDWINFLKTKDITKYNLKYANGNSKTSSKINDDGSIIITVICSILWNKLGGLTLSIKYTETLCGIEYNKTENLNVLLREHSQIYTGNGEAICVEDFIAKTFVYCHEPSINAVKQKLTEIGIKYFNRPHEQSITYRDVGKYVDSYIFLMTDEFDKLMEIIDK